MPGSPQTLTAGRRPEPGYRSGEAGGSWRATLKNGQLSYEEGSVAGMPVVFNFDPNDFVLTSFQRISGGAAIGDQALAARIRRLWFKI